MAKSQPEENTPSLPPLPPRELTLVRAALDQVRRIPVNAPDEQAVVKMLRIRKNLEKQVKMYDELREQARREVKWSLITSFALSTLVLILGFWRMLARSAVPLDVLDDPIKFLVLFTLLFLLAWTPLIVALVRRRKLRKRADDAPMGDPGPALKVFDVTVIRGLVRLSGQNRSREQR